MATSTPLSDKTPEETHNPGQELADRELNPDAYNKRQKTAAGNPTDPRGNDTAAEDSSDPRGSDTAAGDSSDPRSDLRNSEKSAANPDAAPRSQNTYDNQVGKGYRAGQAPKKLTLRGLMTKK